MSTNSVSFFASIMNRSLLKLALSLLFWVSARHAARRSELETRCDDHSRESKGRFFTSSLPQAGQDSARGELKKEVFH